MLGRAFTRCRPRARAPASAALSRPLSAAAATPPPPLPLEGKLVVTIEQAVAAPYCSSRLADAGARVIKIERPEGDFARNYDKFASGLSSYFVWLNRGKESLVSDIKAAEDKELLYSILAEADVFIQNLAPGAAARSGFGSAELRERFPQLICVDISGYGEGNEYSSMKAYDLLVQAESGLSSVTGQAGGSVGGRVGVSICDIGCGMYCYSAVLEALMSRELSGEGCVIDASLFSAVSDWMTVPLLHYESDGQGPKRVGLASVATLSPTPSRLLTTSHHPFALPTDRPRQLSAVCRLAATRRSIHTACTRPRARRCSSPSRTSASSRSSAPSCCSTPLSPTTHASPPTSRVLSTRRSLMR